MSCVYAPKQEASQLHRIRDRFQKQSHPLVRHDHLEEVEAGRRARASQLRRVRGPGELSGGRVHQLASLPGGTLRGGVLGHPCAVHRCHSAAKKKSIPKYRRVAKQKVSHDTATTNINVSYECRYLSYSTQL